jgi:Ca2+-binding RTX toxin-like protein
VSLSVNHGTLALNDATGITFDAVNDTLIGSVAAIDAVLAKGVIYTPANGFNGDDTLTVTANDQGHNSTGNAQSNTQTLDIPVTHAITGIAGENVLTGSAANDTFTGGNGSDQFVFNADVHGTGHDTITDFAPAQDVINLNYSALPSDTANFNTWLSGHATVVNGHDLLIDLNAEGSSPSVDTILLKNVTLASLHSSDFHFTTGSA